MPIKAENRALYPPEWRTIRTAAVDRAKRRCQRCGVPNYAVGWRDADGRFRRAGGNRIWDDAGFGALPYAEARELADYANDVDDGGPNGERVIVIVLTVAHLNHDPTDCRADNLEALCQRCHLRHDQAHHQRTAASTRRTARHKGDLFAETTT